MRIESLSIQGFRNIAQMEFLPCSGTNIIYGDNAQGKTNLLEAVWLFSGAKSFRGAKDSEYVGFGRDHASLNLQFQADNRSQTASIVYSPDQRAVQLNEIKQDRIGKLAGIFCTVVFSPDHLSLVKDGPEKRRRMIDASLCQAYPKYGKILEGYEKTLRQRNRLLKDIPYHSSLLDTLDTWDQNLLEYGAYITRMRARYVARLAGLAAEVYDGISKGREEFAAVYQPSFGGSVDGFEKGDFRNALEKAIKTARPDDIRLGSSTMGPHRDDIGIDVAGVSARAYGSQGQQRSCILALKLAECQILAERSGEPPVVLLDDVMSELDDHRRSYLLNQLTSRQVLITCCDASAFADLADGQVFHLHGGALV